MTTLEYNQIKENFKPAKLVHEVLKIHLIYSSNPDKYSCKPHSC